MKRALILAAVVSVLLGLAWLQWGGTVSGRLTAMREALLRDNAADRQVIEVLKGENAQAREEIAKLRETARQAELRAQGWQAQAARAQAQAQDAKAKLDRLVQERAAMTRITTVDEAAKELRRLGY